MAEPILRSAIIRALAEKKSTRRHAITPRHQTSDFQDVGHELKLLINTMCRSSINLPASLEQIAPETDKIGLAPVGTERILFIDDEEMLAKMGQAMLEKLGYAVTAQRSSIEALATFKNQPEAFDLVITDQTMPGIIGFHMARYDG